MTVARTSNRVFVGENFGKAKSSPAAIDRFNTEFCQSTPRGIPPECNRLCSGSGYFCGGTPFGTSLA
jgi:hypothetical protein